MGFSKWIGASIGWSFGGPIGAIIGMAVGSLLDASSKGGASNSRNQAATRSGPRGMHFNRVCNGLKSLIFKSRFTPVPWTSVR